VQKTGGKQGGGGVRKRAGEEGRGREIGARGGGTRGRKTQAKKCFSPEEERHSRDLYSGMPGAVVRNAALVMQDARGRREE
jgi:hypothetical protein